MRESSGKAKSNVAATLLGCAIISLGVISRSEALAVEAAPGKAVVGLDVYPLDAVGRKLMFGARKGVSEEVLRLFMENSESNLA